MSTLTTPRNGSVMVASLLPAGALGAVSRPKPSQASPNQDDSRRQGRDALGPLSQDAADDLVQRLLGYAMALRASGLQASSDLGPPDLDAVGFLDELGEIAAAGGDIRQRLFG